MVGLSTSNGTSANQLPLTNPRNNAHWFPWIRLNLNPYFFLWGHARFPYAGLAISPFFGGGLETSFSAAMIAIIAASKVSRTKHPHRTKPLDEKWFWQMWCEHAIVCMVLTYLPAWKTPKNMVPGRLIKYTRCMEIGKILCYYVGNRLGLVTSILSTSGSRLPVGFEGWVLWWFLEIGIPDSNQLVPYPPLKTATTRRNWWLEDNP